MQYWLMKSEPDVYSIDDLERDKKSGWDGIRNYQARNYMREMQTGDLVLFYHSNASPSAVAGIAKVTRCHHPDPSQFDRDSQYFDAKSDPTAPRWSQVEISFERRLPQAVGLAEIKKEKDLADMALVKRSRLSILPVSGKEWARILKMGGA